MKKTFLSFLLFFIFQNFSFAGNVAGGDLNIRCINGMSYEFNVTLWGENFLPTDTLQVFFGDNTWAKLSNQSASSIASLAPAYPDYSEINWLIPHTFPGPGTYTAYIIYTSRIVGIVNIPGSSNTIISLNATLIVDPNIGCNSSPVITNNNLIEQLDVSVANNYFNPGAVDPDGDSLSFSYSPCLDSSGIIAGYVYPHIIGGGTFNLNPVTGDYSWNPQTQGRYNIDCIIEQWKLFPNNQRHLVGTTMREIQFDVGTLSGIQDKSPASFSLFPNPVSAGENVAIDFEITGQYSIEVLSVEGKLIFAANDFFAAGQILQLPELSPGIYFVKIAGDGNEGFIKKLIVKNP
ncbi:MAG: T9SS type A sorting domain-containing protein [Bacteroidia bacterium]